MKKLLSLTVILIATMCLFLTGCVNEGMADKINKKADSDQGYTYQQLISDYNSPTIDVNLLAGRTVIYVANCKAQNALEEKLDNKEEVKGVIVIVALDRVISAEYKVITEDDYKN